MLTKDFYLGTKSIVKLESDGAVQVIQSYINSHKENRIVRNISHSL